MIVVISGILVERAMTEEHDISAAGEVLIQPASDYSIHCASSSKIVPTPSHLIHGNRKETD